MISSTILLFCFLEDIAYTEYPEVFWRSLFFTPIFLERGGVFFLY